MTFKESIVRLYKDGFPEDSAKSVEYFFANKYREENVYANDSLTTCLHIVYKKARFDGKTFELPYIVAFSTLQERRGKGEAREVMTKALRALKNKGYPLVALYPFSHDYYLRYGFFNIDRDISSPTCDRERYIASELETARKMAGLYDKAMRNTDGYIYKDEQACLDRLREEGADGAYLELLIADGHEIGYALTNGETDFETVYANAEYRDTPNVQMRALDYGKLLAGYNYLSPASFSLTVKDDILGDESFLVEYDGSECRVTAVDYAGEYILGAGELAAAVLGSDYADKRLKHIFPDKKLYFTDKY